MFDGWLPDVLPDGDLLLVNPPQDTSFFSVGAAQSASGDLTVNADDPRMQNVAPYAGAVTLRELRPLSGIDWATVLAIVGSQPTIAAGEVEIRQVALLGFDARYPNTDLVLQPAWPILMAELTSWFSPTRAIDVTESVTPGTPVSVRFVDAANRAEITRPNGARAVIDAVASTAVFADTLLPGVYRVALYDGNELVRTESFAVNLFDAGESRIAPASSVTIGTTTITQAVRQETGRREWWAWVAGLGLVLLVLEWWIYHRTRRHLPRATLTGSSTASAGLLDRARAVFVRRRKRRQSLAGTTLGVRRSR